MDEDLKVKCAGCKKKLSVHKMHFLPGKVVYDKLSDMTYNTGRNYCDECFAQIMDVSFEVGAEEHKMEERVTGYRPREPKIEKPSIEKKITKVFKGQMPSYDVKKDKISGFIQKVIHAKAKNGALYKVVKFRDDTRYFYVWDKKLYENIKAGDIVEAEFVQTKFPRIVMVEKSKQSL